MTVKLSAVTAPAASGHTYIMPQMGATAYRFSAYLWPNSGIDRGVVYYNGAMFSGCHKLVPFGPACAPTKNVSGGNLFRRKMKAVLTDKRRFSHMAQATATH